MKLGSLLASLLVANNCFGASDTLRAELPAYRALLEARENCTRVFQELGSLTPFADASGWSIWGKGHYQKKHQQYQATAEALRGENWFGAWEKKLGRGQADKLLQTCAANKKLTLEVFCRETADDWEACGLAKKIGERAGWFSSAETLVLDRVAVLDSLEKAANGELRELRKESIYLMRLKSYKSEISLDPTVHMKNAANAQYHDVMVSEGEFRKHREGDALSSKFNAAGMFTKGEFASYKIQVDKLSEVSAHLLVDAAGKTTPVSKDVYEALLAELKARGASAQESASSGVRVLHLLDKPKGKLKIAKVEPKVRYFVDVEIKNSTLSLDLMRNIQNSLTAHQMEFEVPQAIYEQKNSLFEPNFNEGAFLTKGTFNSISGRIINRRKALDPEQVEITLVDGRTMTIPKSELKEYGRAGQGGESAERETPAPVDSAR